MGAPKLRRVSSEEYQDAPDWFRRFLDTLNPFLGDVSGSLGGGSIGRELLRQQVETFRVNTESTLTNTFTNSKVAFKNKLGVKPVSVRVGQISSTTAAAVMEEAWITPSALTGSWVQFGSGEIDASYMKDSLGWVNLQGIVKSGTIGQSIFTLPVGYRPTATSRFAVVSFGAFGQCSVGSDGTVLPAIGNNTDFSLHGIRFRADLSVSPEVQWEVLTSGLIRVNYIPGLGSNRTYDVTLIIE